MQERVQKVQKYKKTLRRQLLVQKKQKRVNQQKYKTEKCAVLRGTGYRKNERSENKYLII